MYEVLQNYTQLAKMSFDKIFDLTAGVYILVYNTRPFSYTVGFRKSKTALFDWICFGWILLVFLLIVSLLEFIAFVLFLEAVGVSTAERQSKSVDRSVPRAFSTSSCSTNPRPSELVAFGFAESRQSYVRGVSFSREPPKLQQVLPLLAA